MVKRLDPHRYDEYQGKTCEVCGYVIDNPDDYLVTYFDGPVHPSQVGVTRVPMEVCCHCDVILCSPRPWTTLKARCRSIKGNGPDALSGYRRLGNCGRSSIDPSDVSPLGGT